MRRIVVLTAVILTLMIVPTSIYALQNPRNSTGVKTPEEMALDFIKDSPTFKFDGITSTLVVEDVYLNKSYPPQYVVTFSFQCLHSGYGNRAGDILLQVITPHTAVVTIKDGVVLSTVIDGVWDEVAQKNVEDQGKAYVEAVALNWLVNAPTFKFDGVEGSATIVDSWLAMTFAAPSFWGVTIEFDCLHAGYGDRTGQMVAQMITHHVVTIHVTEGEVTLAVMDDQWDELKQEEIEAPVILTPDQARDIAMRHFLESLGMDPTAPTEWEEENITPEGILGVQKTRYTSGEWVVTIENAVVWKPTYTVTIEKGDASWEGKVDQDGAVTDGSEPEMPQLIYTPDIARKICLDYLMEKHPEVAKEIPIEWTEKNLVSEGLVGFTNVEYTSGDWTVTVSAPVVWKPTHTVSISYSGEGGSFTWEGTLPQGGPVEETSFSK